MKHDSLQYFLLISLSFITVSSSGVSPNQSTISIDLDGKTVQASWDLLLSDLSLVVPMDSNGDEALSEEEILAQEAAVRRYLFSKLTVEYGHTPCNPLTEKDALVVHSDPMYVTYNFQLDCTVPNPDTLTFDYRPFFEKLPEHVGLLKITAYGDTNSTLLTKEGSKFAWVAPKPSFFSRIKSAFRSLTGK